MSIEVPNFIFAIREDIKNQEGFIPSKTIGADTGWDVRCAEPDGVKIKPFEYKIIRLGIRVYAPKGWWLELRPRSSSHAKKHLNCLYGVIDELYEKEIGFSCQYIPSLEISTIYAGAILPTQNYVFNADILPLEIKFGERIGQLIPVKRQFMITSEVSNEEFDKLCKERQGARGIGGFGSTG